MLRVCMKGENGGFRQCNHLFKLEVHCQQFYHRAINTRTTGQRPMCENKRCTESPINEDASA